MEDVYLHDKVIERVAKEALSLPRGEYESCTFRQCDLSGNDFSGFHFIDCIFEDSNLSLAKLNQTVLRDVFFRNCKMLGLHWEDCHSFGLSFSFEGCILNDSTFYQVKMKNTIFKNCVVKGVDFSQAGMEASLFENCDLDNAVFVNADLSGADFSNSYNYRIDPEQNNLKKAKFNIEGLPGLLTKYDLIIQ